MSQWETSGEIVIQNSFSVIIILMALRKDFTSVCIIPNQLEDDILKCNTKFELTTMDVYLIIQGSIQEERSRHLQEDLNASKEKYEKSLEEVKSVRDWCRSLSIPLDLKIRFVKANFPYWCYRLPRRKKRFEVCKTRFWPRRNNTLSGFNRCELYSNVNEGEKEEKPPPRILLVCSQMLLHLHYL